MSDTIREYLTPHFTVEEMQCPCCKKCKMDTPFMAKLELLRNEVRHPLAINSGYRCAKHNTELRGSSPNSLHMKGKAADISWDELDAFQKANLLTRAMKYFGGIGIAKTYLHVDIGFEQKLWIY